jgi:hypothetical protein
MRTASLRTTLVGRPASTSFTVIFVRTFARSEEFHPTCEACCSGLPHVRWMAAQLLDDRVFGALARENSTTSRLKSTNCAAPGRTGLDPLLEVSRLTGLNETQARQIGISARCPGYGGKLTFRAGPRGQDPRRHRRRRAHRAQPHSRPGARPGPGPAPRHRPQDPLRPRIRRPSPSYGPGLLGSSPTNEPCFLHARAVRALAQANVLPLRPVRVLRRRLARRVGLPDLRVPGITHPRLLPRLRRTTDSSRLTTN